MPIMRSSARTAAKPSPSTMARSAGIVAQVRSKTFVGASDVVHRGEVCHRCSQYGTAGTRRTPQHRRHPTRRR